ncbi:MAG: AAA family ATPase [Bacteroidales bacterium]|nr:AAA family ATPase [Bacteroidales bacterium]
MSGRSASEPNAGVCVRRMEAAVAERIGSARYQLWFQAHTAFVPCPGELRVVVPTLQFREWLEETFAEAIRAAAHDVFGSDHPVRFVVEPELFASASESASRSNAEDAKPETVPTASRSTAAEPTPQPSKRSTSEKRRTLFGDEIVPPEPPRGRAGVKPKPETGRRWKSLDDFVVGASNRVAHASARSVIEDPGQGGNPLVLHGPVGTGKTHLLEGIYAGFRKQFARDFRPTFVTAEEFTTRFVQATRFGKQSAFRRQFRDCSALLLDDLDLLATKRATQEEFLYTFDSLISDGCQIVVTMDCHPRLADELMPELVDRLLGGAVWGLLPPDDETRLGILRQRAAQPGPAFPDEVLKFLARSLRGNVRELEGAINSVRHYARVTGGPISPQLAREALGDLLRHVVRTVTLADVDAAVCAMLRLANGALQSKARTWAVSHPRMLAVFLARKHTTATYGEIARYFGAKNHSTAVAAEKKVRGWLQNDEPLSLGERVWATRDLLDRIERELQR